MNKKRVFALSRLLFIRMVKITPSEDLTYLLVKYGAMVTSRPEKYATGHVIPTQIDLEAALKENPRFLAPLVVLLTQHPIFLKKFREIPLDILETVKALRKGKPIGPDCRYENFKKLIKLCNIRNDGRVKATTERKVRKEWRLAPDVIEKIEAKVRKGKFSTGTEFIEALVRGF